MTSTSNEITHGETTPNTVKLRNEFYCKNGNMNDTANQDNSNSDQDNKLARLYQAAKDENELLEFKNYELLFKIQELEQNQRKILSKLVIADSSNVNCKLQDKDDDESNFEIRQDRQSNNKKSKHDYNNHDNNLKNRSHTTEQKLLALRGRLASKKETLPATATTSCKRTPTTNSSSDLAVKKKSSDLLLSIAATGANKELIDGTILTASKINDRYEAREDGESNDDDEEEGVELGEVGKKDTAKKEKEMMMIVNTKKVGQQDALAAKWNQRQRQEANLKLSNPDLSDTASIATATCSKGARSEELVPSSEQQLSNSRSSSNNNLLIVENTQLLSAPALHHQAPECNQRNGYSGDELRDTVASMLKLNATSQPESEKLSANHLGHENMNRQMQVDYSLGARNTWTNKRQICGLHDMDFEVTNSNNNNNEPLESSEITKPFLGSTETATPLVAANAIETNAASKSQQGEQQEQFQQVICGNSMASMNLDEVQKLIEYNGSQKKSTEQQVAVTLQSCELTSNQLKVQPQQQQVGGPKELPLQQDILTSSSKPPTKVMISGGGKVGGDELTTMDNYNSDDHYDHKDDCYGQKVVQEGKVRVSEADNELVCNSYFTHHSNWSLNKSHTDEDDGTINEHANGLHSVNYSTSFGIITLTGYDLNDEQQQQQQRESLSESLPIDQSFSGKDSSEQQHKKQLGRQEKNSSKHSRMPTVKIAKSALNQEERKKLTTSQPNLASQTMGPQAAARRSTGNARIAVPVTRKIPSISSGGKQQANQQQQRQPLSLPANKTVNSCLRVRSKSSFDQSSLPRRSTAAIKQQQQQQQAKQVVSRASSISNVKSAINNDHESSSSVNGVAEQQVSTNSANNKSSPSTLPNASPLRVARNRSRSSSSIGFVTQIPTLISQSHAQALGAPTSEFAAKRMALRQPPGSVSAAILPLGTTSEAESNEAIYGHSKSMSNLVLPSNFRCTAATTTRIKLQQNDAEFDCSAKQNSNSTVREEKCGSDSPREELLSKKLGDKATYYSKTTRSLLPKAPKGKSLSLHCMSMINYDDQDDEDDLVHQRRTGAASDDDDDDDHDDDQRQRPKDVASEKQPAAICVSNEEEGEATATSCEPPSATKASQDENTSPTLNSILANNNNIFAQQQQQQPCAQCKLLQSKVNLLIKDRKQLNEQINELEEMENDSRLMSQKLSQQLQLVEQQLDECKLELHKMCDSESKLQFQNRRLNFELQERFQSIEKLQGQLNKIKSGHEDNESFPTAAKLDQQLCPSCKSSNSKSNSIGNGNSSNNNNNNGIDLTRNNNESSSSSLASPTTAQSEHRKSCKTTLPEAKQVVQQQQIQEELPTNNMKQQTDRSPALSMSNSDDDSAIDMFEKASLANSVPISLDSQQRRTFILEDENKSTNLKNNEEIKRASLCDDSAYSKSSASSDANSDDGHRSDYDQLIELSGQETSNIPVSINVSLKASGHVVESNTKRAELSINGSNKSNSDLHTTNIASSSSSGDESDHHERESNAFTPVQQQQVEQSNQQQSSSESATSNQQQQQQQQQQPIQSQVVAGGSSALAGRQQVLRKKISTARILRGIQVQYQPRSSSPINKVNNNGCGRAIERAHEQEIVERPSTSWGSNKTLSSSALSSSSSSFKSTVGQARFAQVVLPEADSDRSIVAATTITTATTTTTSITSCETKREQQNNNIQQVTSAKDCESPIDLALKGVEQLEQGSRTDEALRSLIGGDTRNNIQIATSPLTTTSVENGNMKMSGSDFESGGTKEHGNIIVQSSNLINQFKSEIASLKMRLLQAHTLNDNLVSELKSNKDRLDQLVGQLSSQHAASQRQQVEHHKQRQHQHHNHHHQQAVELEPLRRRSIVYVNGFRADPRGQEQPMNNVNNNSSSIDCYLQPPSSSSPTSSSLSGNNKQQLPSNNHFLHTKTACVSQSELLDFLRFLLDKVHFHHGRTFELVNECQKLAMNALLASYSHQMNLIHHNSAVMAGDQATKRMAIPVEVSGHHRYFPQPQQPQRTLAEVYPVRPPPRRRNATNRMMPEEHQLGLVQADQQAANIGGVKPTQQLDLQATASNNSININNRSSTSALQVAKKTLFSIVPIYHNSNNNSNSNGNDNGNICNNNSNSSFEANNSKKFAIKQNNKEINSSNKQQSCESLNLDNVKMNGTNNNYLSSRKLSNILNSPSSQIKRLHAKSKSWIVLNSTPSSSPSKANKGQQEAYYANLDANSLHQQAYQQQQQQQNVSVLEINRTTMNTSTQNIGRLNPDEQQQHHHQVHSLVQPLLQQQQHQQQPDSLATSQNLFKAKNSLSEDIERYRIRFNGQLLDLLTRQNWCESIISEKIRIYQAFEQQNLQQQQQQQQQACKTVFTSSESRFHLVTSETNGAKNIYSMASKQSTSVPTIVSSISFNPNGTIISHQQQQQYQQHLESRPSLDQKSSSSFC